MRRITRITSLSPGLLISCGVLLQLLLLSPGVSASEQHRGQRHKPQHAARKAAPSEQPIDMQTLATQVMLDRAGYSPGEIDAAPGTSTERALDAFTKNGGNAAALPPDALVDYTITEQDAAGPFTPSIPSDMMAMAKTQTGRTVALNMDMRARTFRG